MKHEAELREQRSRDLLALQGGSVEVYPEEEGARNDWSTFSPATESGLFAEYGYVKGPILLRVSQEFTPEQATEYEQALTQVG